jgi:F0F1-type ATP synthase membrane subunit b/b'
MAQLVLVPNPVVLAVQAGVFLANVVVIKKLMLEPYLAVRDRREKLTQGNRDEAGAIVTRCEALATDINQRLVTTAQTAQKAKESIRNTALEKRNAILAAAEAESRATIDKMAAEVKQTLAAERAKVPQVVQQLTQQVFQLAVQ